MQKPSLGNRAQGQGYLGQPGRVLGQKKAQGPQDLGADNRGSRVPIAGPSSEEPGGCLERIVGDHMLKYGIAKLSWPNGHLRVSGLLLWLVLLNKVPGALIHTAVRLRRYTVIEHA
jgi:hypothetical protein